MDKRSEANYLYPALNVNLVLGHRNFRVSLLVGACALMLALAAQASAFTATPARTFPFTGTGTSYGYGHDGTFWISNQSGTVTHVDDDGNALAAPIGTGISPTYDIAYWAGRVWLSTPSASKLVGADIAGVQPNVIPDAHTLSRLGSTQRAIRMTSNGVVMAALGQNNKIALLDVTNTTGNMFYPQVFFGLGISKNFTVTTGITWDTCQYGPGPPSGGSGDPDYCGTYDGRWDTFTYPQGLGRPEDIAAGVGGSLYVTESDANRVTQVITPTSGGRLIGAQFGSGPGTAAGQLDYPQYIAYQPGSNYVYVTERDNRRISVFGSGGGYIASFGYGVRTGANQIEVCGIGYGPCQAGIAYATNPKSYWGRLDFIGDQLYAHMPLTGQMQVFDVGGAPGTDPVPPPINPIVKAEKVRLNASSTKVRKGKKVTFTAKLRDHNVAVCGSRKVSFQVQDGRSWDKVKSVKVDKKKCTASIKRSVKKRQTFRAVLINSLNQATVATSPKVTISIKKK